MNNLGKKSCFYYEEEQLADVIICRGSPSDMFLIGREAALHIFSSAEKPLLRPCVSFFAQRNSSVKVPICTRPVSHVFSSKEEQVQDICKGTVPPVFASARTQGIGRCENEKGEKWEKPPSPPLHQ